MALTIEYIRFDSSAAPPVFALNAAETARLEEFLLL